MMLKKILFWVAIVFPFGIFLAPEMYRDLGEYGWYMLSGVLLIRPLANIFPDLGILRALMLMRREFGIFSATLIMAHFAGFLMMNGTPFFNVFSNKVYWDLNHYLGWGTFGLVAALPVLLTSNKFSMIHLKKWWKVIQRLSYIFFIFGGIHIFLMGEESGLILLVVVTFFWVLARFKVKIKFLKQVS